MSLKWLEEERVVLSGPNKLPHTVRTAMLSDESAASIKISIWGELIKAVVEDITFKITSLKCEDFFGSRLASLSASTITKIETGV